MRVFPKNSLWQSKVARGISVATFDYWRVSIRKKWGQNVIRMVLEWY